VTEEGIAYLYKTEGAEERRRALAAVAGISPVGLTAKANETAEFVIVASSPFQRILESIASKPTGHYSLHGVWRTLSHGLAAFICRQPSSGAGNGTAKTNHEIVYATRHFGPV
jgi:hypothetical protein